MNIKSFSYLWGLTSLLLFPTSLKAQEEHLKLKEPANDAFAIKGIVGDMPLTDCVKYEKDHIYVQNGDIYYDIDLSLEWPVLTTATEENLSMNVFGVEASDMNSAISAYLNRLGTRIDKISFFEGIKIHYVTIKLAVADYVSSKYLTTFLYYSDQPAPYMKDKPVLKKTYHTYKWYDNGIQVSLDDILSKKGINNQKILQEVNSQYSNLKSGFISKMIPRQIAVFGSNLIFQTDIVDADEETNIGATLDMNGWQDCLSEEGCYLLGFSPNLVIKNKKASKETEKIVKSEKEITFKKDYIDDSTKAKVFDVVESLPTFPGGTSALMSFLSSNIKYPADAFDAKIMGRVVVQFVVERDGSISNVIVVNMVSPSLDREAARVIMSMPKWEPGRQNGEPVRVKYNVPISFKF